MRAAVGVQFPNETIICGTTKLVVARRGVGIPVLCLHSTGHGGRDYEDFAERLAPAGFEFVLVDWPGHGNSPKQPPGMNMSATAYATLLETLISKLWGKKSQPIIIGNSIGGAAAIRVAAKRPDLVRALVLCNPGGLAGLNLVAKLYIGHMVRFFEGGAQGKERFAKAYERYYRAILPLTPAAEQRERIVAAGPEMAPLMAQAWNSFRQPDADIRALASTIQCPVFFAWAKDDKIVSWRSSKAAAVTVPDHRLQLFPGGHSPFLESPAAFDAAFLDFVSSLGAGKDHKLAQEGE